MTDGSRPLREHRLALFGLVLPALAGVVLLFDGSLHGKPRHRLLGVALGALLCVPLVSFLILKARVLRFWKRLGVSLATAAVALGVFELAIRILDLRTFSVPVIERHPILGHAHAPGRGQLDDWGFRNRRVPERADVVCLGDSQTYGTNIHHQDSFPSVLAGLSGLEVYNMSLGGYGPIQFLAMTERALSLEPETIVVGFFFGNDLVDAHRFAGLETWKHLSDPELTYPVPDDVNFGDRRSLNLTMALIDGLIEKSRLLESVTHQLKLGLKANPFFTDLYWQDGQPRSYEQGKIRTVFAPAYRQKQVDLKQPAVRDGLRITGHCFDAMRDLCAERDVELALLFIHSKEYYYHEFLKSRGEPEAAMLAGVGEAEAEVTELMLELARRANMTIVDPEPEVLHSLDNDTPLWPPGPDGHLNREGCRLLAEVLWRELEKLHAVSSPNH